MRKRRHHRPSVATFVKKNIYICIKYLYMILSPYYLGGFTLNPSGGGAIANSLHMSHHAGAAIGLAGSNFASIPQIGGQFLLAADTIDAASAARYPFFVWKRNSAFARNSLSTASAGHSDS